MAADQPQDVFPPSVFSKLPTAGVPFMQPTPNAKAYAPGRDIAYVYPLLISDLQRRIEQKYSDGMLALMAKIRGKQELTPEEDEGLWREVNDAHMAVVKFIHGSCKNPDQTLTEVLREAGYFEIAQDARAMWLAAFGAQGLAILFSAIRDVTVAGEHPPKYLEAEMRRASDVFQLSIGSQDPQLRAVALFKEAIAAALTSGLTIADLEQCVSQRKLG